MSWREFLWTAISLWGFIRGLQLATRYVRRRSLLISSKQNGILRSVAFIGTGRSLASALVEGLFLLGGAAASFAPPRIPQSDPALNIIALYGIMIGAFILAVWLEAEMRLDNNLMEQELLKKTREGGA